MAFKFECKEMCFRKVLLVFASLFSQSVVGQFTPQL